jgi:FMN hydrolase / 5-amino-6-(5-phospho-D-ribitylamino)uracil phosphatase
MTEASPALAVTFDFGQTLCDLDTGMLSRRLRERGIDASEDRLAAAVPHAWRTYDAAIHQGQGGHPWTILMARLLEVAGIGEGERQGAVEWLWSEQPRNNLWRRPIAGMIELVDDLRRASVKVGIISNSEGRLAELVEEVGWGDRFLFIADSGKLGMEKPASPIFEWAASRLSVAPRDVVHIGDSLAADVEGALNAGMRAIWFRGRGLAELTQRSPRVEVAADAAGVRAALRGFGLAAASA